MDFLEAYTDGATRVSNPGESSSAVVFPGLITLGRYIGWRTNNEAEYEALIMALEYTLHETDYARLRVYTDSQLLVKQMKGEWRVHEDKPTRPLWEKAFILSRELIDFEIVWVRGHDGNEYNEYADIECNRVLDDVQESKC